MTTTGAETTGTAPAAPSVAPAKAARLACSLRAVLDEMERGVTGEAARRRLVETHQATLVEIGSALPDDCIDELVRLGVRPLDPDAQLEELRLATAQLLGWVRGLVAGLPTPREEPDQSPSQIGARSSR